MVIPMIRDQGKDLPASPWLRDSWATFHQVIKYGVIVGSEESEEASWVGCSSGTTESMKNHHDSLRQLSSPAESRRRNRESHAR